MRYTGRKASKCHSGGMLSLSRTTIGSSFLLTLIIVFVLASLWATPVSASEEAAVAEEDIVAETEAALDASVEPDEPAVTAVEEAAPAVSDEGGEDASAPREDEANTQPAAETAVAAVANDGNSPSTAVCDDCLGEVTDESTSDAAAANYGGDNQDVEECIDPALLLELICGDAFWASQDDYNAGLLSQNFSLTNNGPTAAVNVRVVSATATQGVKVDDTLPLQLGSLQPGEKIEFILKWIIPQGVKYYETDISICADCEPKVCEDCEPVCEGPGCNPPVDNVEDPPADPAPVSLTASVLPSTGFDSLTLLIFGLGLIMIGGSVPAVRMIRQRKS